MDELAAAKKLQSKLEETISEWSLQRLRWDRRLKNMRLRMLTIGALILLLQAIHLFTPQLIMAPYNGLMTLAFSIWLVVLVVKYAIGYMDKNCTRSADRLIKLAAEYNEAVKDIPNARHCDFLPPELFMPKRFSFHKRVVTPQPVSLPLQPSSAKL